MRPAVRYEIKYRLTPQVADDVLQHISRYMTADEHGEGGSADYPVHSLYLDSPDFSTYWDTKKKAYSRFKIRARCYNFEPERSFFLEIKSRSGEAMTKTRALATVTETRDVLGGLLPARPLEKYDSNMHAFLKVRDARRAQSTCWVTYQRTAYVGGERGLVRITFDNHIRAGLPTADLSEPERWYDLPEVRGLSVLEVKYTGSYPAWVAEVVRRCNLNRSSMSKYRQGIEALTAHNLIPALGAV